MKVLMKAIIFKHLSKNFKIILKDNVSFTLICKLKLEEVSIIDLINDLVLIFHLSKNKIIFFVDSWVETEMTRINNLIVDNLYDSYSKNNKNETSKM